MYKAINNNTQEELGEWDCYHLAWSAAVDYIEANPGTTFNIMFNGELEEIVGEGIR